MLWHPLSFPVMLSISILNCFLAGATHTLTLCNTSLNGVLLNVFKAKSGVPILNVLSVNGYLDVRKSLRKYGLVFANQLLDYYGLLATELGSIDVYMDGSVKSLESISACGGVVAYFSKANMSIGVKVIKLLFSMLVELQAIALVLECVPRFSTVTLFMNS
ncbi:hypothetical protein G9A89_011607 [Geosiphon pyriformis]|nr:hypothetical protein G9A89_011607 [Geosiphon pyriformis]